MGQVLDEVIAALSVGYDHDRAIQAADLLTRHHSPWFRSGDPQVDAATLTDVEAERLRSVLSDGIRRESDLDRAGTFAWALAKSPQSPEVFRELLLRALHAPAPAPGTLFQALIALHNLDELRPETDGPWTFDQYEDNVRLARAYLRSKGIQP